MNDLYDAVNCVRPISLDIWPVERSVCFWPSYLSRPTSSSTVVTFSSVRACFGLLISHLWSVLPVFRIVFCKASTPSLLQFIVKNSVLVIREPYSLNWYKFLISALSSLPNDMLRYRYIVTALKIIIYNNIVCFCLQTPKMYLELNII